jgi:hypothetical protein
MDVDSDSDTASSGSIGSDTMGLPLADAIEPFPGGGDGSALLVSFPKESMLLLPSAVRSFLLLLLLRVWRKRRVSARGEEQKRVHPRRKRERVHVLALLCYAVAS